jgi:FlaG/FlaF family flagellin (archaellin)
MITDAQLRFSLLQDLAGAAATTVSTNAVDLLSANSNPGAVDRARIIVQATEAFAGGTSVKVEVIQSANADLSSPDVLATGAVVTTANATLGAVLFDQHVPNTTERYLGVQYTTIGTMTAGMVDANTVETVDHQPYVPSNTGR